MEDTCTRERSIAGTREALVVRVRGAGASRPRWLPSEGFVNIKHQRRQIPAPEESCESLSYGGRTPRASRSSGCGLRHKPCHD